MHGVSRGVKDFSWLTNKPCRKAVRTRTDTDKRAALSLGHSKLITKRIKMDKDRCIRHATFGIRNCVPSTVLNFIFYLHLL